MPLEYERFAMLNHNIFPQVGNPHMNFLLQGILHLPSTLFYYHVVDSWINIFQSKSTGAMYLCNN